MPSRSSTCTHGFRAAPRIRAAAGALAFSALAAGCAGTPRDVPATELLVAAGDSTVWIRTDGSGVHVRRAPLFLARVDGRFAEIYVTEDDHSFRNAVFATNTVWRRDLLTNDSVAVFVDTTVPRLAAEWAAANPGQRPLDPDDSGSEDPSVTAVVEVELVDVRGPFLTIESFSDLHLGDGTELHRTRRAVIDLRSGREVTLAALVGDSVRARLVADAAAVFRSARDSVLRHSALRESRSRAAAALDRFTFDERSFSLIRTRGGPAVAFYVPNEGADVEVEVLPLAPLAIPGGAWWTDATAGLPEGDDSAEGTLPLISRWPRANGIALLARLLGDGEMVALTLRDARGREWPLGFAAAPAQRAWWLDETPLSAEERAALERAFYDASFYGGEFRAASTRLPAGTVLRAHRDL